jgi:hypothetical protein
MYVRGSILSIQFHCRHRMVHIVERALFSKFLACYAFKSNAVEPGYNDIGLSDTPSITSDVLWYQLICHC